MFHHYSPFFEMTFPLGCQLIDPPGRTSPIDVPFRSDIPILFQLPERSVESCHFDFRIGQGMLLELAGQIITLRLPLRLQEEEHNRLNKSIQISHRTTAGIFSTVTQADLLSHRFELSNI